VALLIITKWRGLDDPPPRRISISLLLLLLSGSRGSPKMVKIISGPVPDGPDLHRASPRPARSIGPCEPASWSTRGCGDRLQIGDHSLLHSCHTDASRCYLPLDFDCWMRNMSATVSMEWYTVRARLYTRTSRYTAGTTREVERCGGF
jgi:hypothetical protein